VPASASDAVSVDPASGGSPRERRLDARRNLEAIVDAARRTFAANPGASMQQVAVAAGLHRATVHRHFASRDDLIATLRQRAVDESLEALRAADLEDGDAPAALLRATQALVRLTERWPVNRYAASAIRNDQTEEMGRLVTAVMARGQAEGTIRGDLDPAVLATVWGGMVSMAPDLRSKGMSDDEAADAIVRTLLGPPAVEAGRATNCGW
jgi:TetR/AcrR family transcriptional regulator, mexCD-oprJ operon repressor